MLYFSFSVTITENAYMILVTDRKNPIFNPVRTIYPDRCTTICQTLKLNVNPLCHTLSEQVTSFKLPEYHLNKLLGVSWHHACCCCRCASIHNFVKTELTPTMLNNQLIMPVFGWPCEKSPLCMFWNRRRFRCVLKGISFLGNYNKIFCVRPSETGLFFTIAGSSRT